MMVRRAALLLSALAFVACNTDSVATDSGVTTETPDGGPIVIPDRPTISGTILDRAGRPFMNDLLVGATTTTAEDARAMVRAAYNSLAPQDYFPGEPLNQGTDDLPRPARFILPDVGLYDALDGMCGVGNLTATTTPDLERYRDLAGLLADDRIWLDTTSSTCATYLAVEQRAFGFGAAPSDDCGGRMPGMDVLDATLWLLSDTAVSDGVSSGDRAVSKFFPYFAVP